jgi:tetratricopeptide (TPR) repeat protein
LPAGTLALFEVASGMMVLSVDLATFQTAVQNYTNQTPTPEEIELFSTINHETYHYFQTLATGYQYVYAAEVWRLIVDEANAQLRRDEIQQTEKQEEEKAIESQLKETAKTELQPKDETEAEGMNALLASLEQSSSMEAKRFTGFMELVQQAEKARSWEDSAKGDYSLLAAELPSLAKGFDQLWAKIRKPGIRGLSAEDLIEGSAVVFQQLLTHGREGMEERLAAARNDADETYRRALKVAQEICGERALDTILPATALALRYTNPPEAYVVFLEKLKACEAGQEISAARALASTPLHIEAAGEYLGTALDVRSKQPRSNGRYPVYDDVLDKLEKREWGFDEIEMMSDRAPAMQIELMFERDPQQQLNPFPFVTVVKEGIIRTGTDSPLLARRVLCASLVLRSVKLPRYRREAEQRLMERLHPIVASIVDPIQAAYEYLQLGIKYLEEKNLDQAQLMLEMAVSLYRGKQHAAGVATSLYNLGVVYGSRNDRERAQEIYRNALEASEAAQDDELIAKCANNLADLYMKVDRLEEAEALMRKAIAIQERLDDKTSMALYCWNLGRIYYARKQMGQAKEFFVKAVENYRAVGDTKMAQGIEEGLAELDKPPEQASQAAG